MYTQNTSMNETHTSILVGDKIFSVFTSMREFSFLEKFIGKGVYQHHT